MNDGISVADALALRNTGNNGNDGMFGGNGAWWVIILILFGLGGWGRGTGFGGGGNDGAPVVVAPYGGCNAPATAQGLTAAFKDKLFSLQIGIIIHFRYIML